MKKSLENYSEWLGGPSLIAIKGDEDPNNQYQLGTREYDWHSHRRGQVFCVEAGLINVSTDKGSWLLPPHRAGWIPPNKLHKVRVSGALSGWTLLIAPHSCLDLPDKPCVIAISEVLRALALRAVKWDKSIELTPDQKRISEVIYDEIRQSPHESLYLPMPSNPRLEIIARTMLENPGCSRTLDEWAYLGALSPRTLRRLILKETGLNFAQWRQQLQLMHCLDLLARGRSITEVSDSLGYASPSNFIAMFKKAFGETPARYFSNKK